MCLVTGCLATRAVPEATFAAPGAFATAWTALAPLAPLTAPLATFPAATASRSPGTRASALVNEGLVPVYVVSFLMELAGRSAHPLTNLIFARRSISLCALWKLPA